MTWVVSAKSLGKFNARMNAKRETAQVGPRRSLQAPPISLIQNSGSLRRLRCSSVIQRTSQIESEPPTVAQRLIPFRAHLPTNRRGATVASRLRRRAADRLSRTVEELDGTPAGARGRHRHGRAAPRPAYRCFIAVARCASGPCNMLLS